MEKIYFIANAEGVAISNPYFSKENLLAEYSFDPQSGEEIVEVPESDPAFAELEKMC